VDTPFEGVARPFINWILHLNKDYEICIILFKCGLAIKEFIENNIDHVDVISVENLSETLNCLNSSKPEMLITDDYFPRLRLATIIKSKVQIRTCIYVQVLHSIHSISETLKSDFVSPKLKVLYEGLKLIPFALLKRPYKELVLQHNVVIANSQITATLLHTLYGIEPYEVIYPPVNTEVFKPNKGEEGNHVFLYLGSHGIDVDQHLVRKICDILRRKGFKILVFGDIKFQKELKNDYEIQQCIQISDEELAKSYSDCLFTICPQKWETFGYVAAESISCGTPVLAFNCMGIAEIMRQSKLGYLANNEIEFLRKLESNPPIKIARDKEVYSWDISYSSRKLADTIESACQKEF
jgi:glycosyltransferase involved in cell wall biosynthesis